MIARGGCGRVDGIIVWWAGHYHKDERRWKDAGIGMRTLLSVDDRCDRAVGSR